MAYDVAIRMVSPKHSRAGNEIYGYNHADQRVFVRDGNTVTDYLYGMGRERLMEFQETCTGGACTGHAENQRWIYFAGRKMFSKTGSTLKAVTPNRLASEAKHFPYGETDGTPPADTKDYFATYRRDGTGLDYASNRYYSPTMGRFTTADPYGGSARLSNPGSQNRYAYASGNPTRYVDPKGLDECDASNVNTCVDVYDDYDDPESYVCDSPTVGEIYEGQLTTRFRSGDLRPVPWLPNDGTIFNLPPFTLERTLNPVRTLGSKNYVEALARVNKAKIGIREGFLGEGCFDRVLAPLGIASIDELDKYFQKIDNAVVLDGTDSGVRIGYLYDHGSFSPLPVHASFGNRTVGSDMRGGNTTAMAELGGARIWVNPMVINSPDVSNGRLQATLMHEVLHNYTGLPDSTLQDRLSLSQNNNTSNITAWIMDWCTKP